MSSATASFWIAIAQRLHNKQWSQMMLAVGLVPSDTGQIDGKRTGQRMTHYIAEGEGFERSCAVLLNKVFSIPWQAISGDEAVAKKKAASKTKYTCAVCELNAWGKPDIRLVCGECEVELIAE